MGGICIVGAGQWGQNHVRSLHSLGVPNLHVCDSNEACIEAMKKTYPNIKFIKNFNDVLADKNMTMVSICTPASTHYDMVKAALRADKDVFVEKPLALTYEHAKELRELAEKTGKILMVGHIFRYHPAIKELKKEIDSGELGKLNMLIASRIGLMTPRPDCGVIFDFAIHEFDTFSYLLGKNPLDMTATGVKCPAEHEFEDAAFITMNYPEGVLGHIQVSWLTPVKVRELIAVGTKRTARINLVSNEIELFNCGIVPQYDAFGKFKLIKHEGGVTVKKVSEEEPLKLEIKHFLECVEKRKLPETDGRCGTNAVFLAEKALDSFKNKKTVPIGNLHEF